MIVGYIRAGDINVPLLVADRFDDRQIHFAPPSSFTRSAGYRNGFVAASRAAWAMNIAYNLAAAFRPEGVP